MSSSCCKPPDASTLPLLCLPMQTRRPGLGLMARHWPDPLLPSSSAEQGPPCARDLKKFNVGRPIMTRIALAANCDTNTCTLCQYKITYCWYSTALFQLLHEQKQLQALMQHAA